MEYYKHLNEDLLLEMSEIGRFDEYKILVYGAEGPISHFHFESIKSRKRGCIRLDKAEYFFHGKYQDKLNSKEIKNLIHFLNSPHKFFGKSGYNNWQIICVYWGDNNLDFQVDIDSPMPDYNQLKSM